MEIIIWNVCVLLVSDSDISHGLVLPHIKYIALDVVLNKFLNK